jgi:hypothetical protein
MPLADPIDPAPLELPVLLHVQDELAAVCASIAEFWGFTRTQGRIFGLLLMSPEPLDQHRDPRPASTSPPARPA